MQLGNFNTEPTTSIDEDKLPRSYIIFVLFRNSFDCGQHFGGGPNGFCILYVAQGRARSGFAHNVPLIRSTPDPGMFRRYCFTNDFAPAKIMPRRSREKGERPFLLAPIAICILLIRVVCHRRCCCMMVFFHRRVSAGLINFRKDLIRLLVMVYFFEGKLRFENLFMVE